MPTHRPRIVIIGAGIGGLASALRLSATGAQITVLESHATPGGKMRTVPSNAGPVDAGPTVLTMKPVFEALFSSVGECLDDHVTLTQEDILARHFWADGTRLDLMADPSESLCNVAAAFGNQAAGEMAKFTNRARKLFEAFDGSMMRAPQPTPLSLAGHVLRNPTVIPAMAPHQSLATSLFRHFSEPRLAQLFSRYATYVGGLPHASPAILALIWHVERTGVWHVQGGMHNLALAIERLAKERGVSFEYDTHVNQIERTATGLMIDANGAKLRADAVLFNGDPQAVCNGLLGTEPSKVVPEQTPRSLSAFVYAFAGDALGATLAAHNVFFADDPHSEYAPLTQGQIQTDPTLYVCAQDRFDGAKPTGSERFEIIMNACPTDQMKQEVQPCPTLISKRLATFGIKLDPPPEALTTPHQFETLFPGSNGSLYGRSPHGMMAAFRRPTARTSMKGLYLVGGGAHPGAGVPMATLSAMHAVAAITQDLTLHSPSRRAATHGGMSMGSATTGPAPSRS